MRASVILAVLLVVALPAVCTAAPTVRGYTGAILTPDTEVAMESSLELGAHAFDIDNLAGLPNRDAESATFVVNAGITEGLEATLALRALDLHIPTAIPVATDEAQLTLHLKYQILGEPDDAIGLAVGATDIFEQWDDAFVFPPLDLADIGFYVVASKNFSDLEAGDPPLRVNAGLLLTNEPLFADNLTQLIPPLQDDTKFFGSLEAGLSEEVTVLAELAGDSFNYGVRVTPNDDIKLDAGWLEAFGSTEFYWGGSYCWTW